MRIALIGTRGVPARYGGFETAIEEIGSRLADAGHHVIVFCRTPEGEEQLETYKGMHLVHLPSLHKRALETLSHTALTVIDRHLKDVDCAVVFNAANAPLLPVIRARRIPVATHVDGLEWRRGKWSGTGQQYYRISEQLAVRWSDALIADAQGIADYYREEFHAPTQLIAYGAPILKDPQAEKLTPLGVESGKYHLVVARFEPENHVLEIVQGYVKSKAEHPLVVVGSAPYSDEYTAAIREAADPRVKLVGGLWDQDQLDQLYANSLTYLHGHSVGGTNPSLLRAGGAAAFTVAWDVDFNREVVQEAGEYFSTPEQLAAILEQVETEPERAQRRGYELQNSMHRYDWDQVARDYEELCVDLMERNFPRRRPSGRRHPSRWSR
ncbi:DUF1972 domain-containing protein [Luteococcus sp. Sow4_B9]|uniref:DUF1972 domain-containing protein n=1 Tax=Luteococcus sp. Sow4_B9 TaxID=3438792 RepID=UPI003F98AF94